MHISSLVDRLGRAMARQGVVSVPDEPADMDIKSVVLIMGDGTQKVYGAKVPTTKIEVKVDEDRVPVKLKAKSVASGIPDGPNEPPTASS